MDGRCPRDMDEACIFGYERASSASRRGRRSLIGAAFVTGEVTARHPSNGAWKYQIECSHPVYALRPVFWDVILIELDLPGTTKAMTWKGLKRISPEQFERLCDSMGDLVTHRLG